MRILLTCWLLWAVPQLSAQTGEGRVLTLAGIPVDLRGGGEKMADPARLVLEKQLVLSGDKTASAPLADDLAFFLQQRYLQQGYPEAVVDWRLSGNTIILDVKEGPERQVGEITFTGVEETEAATLRPYLTRQTKEREGRLARKLPFVSADIEAGLGLVVRRLQADGFLQAAAAEPVFTDRPETGVRDIAVALTPGPLSTFAPVELQGETTGLSRDILKKINGLSGQPYNEVTLENVRKEVAGDLQSAGYFAAEVIAESKPGAKPSGTIPARLTVRPGNRFRVSGLQVADTLSAGARRVATTVFVPDTGHVYDPARLDLSHRRAMDTGLYSRLDVEPVVTGPDTLALKITGEEAKPKTLGLFGGYETFYGPILGIEARHVNFLNTGNALGLRAELRGTGTNGGLQWNDPAFLGSRNALGLSIGLEDFTFKDYTRTTYSLRGSLTRRITRRITAEVSSGLSRNEVESDVLTPAELGPDDYDVLTVGARLMLDFRDNPLNTRSGWLAGAAVEAGTGQGGNADVNYGRADLNAAWYHPFSASWRIALAARASVIRSDGTVAEMPIDLRLFNGGGTTVRSFAEREMGPQSARGSTPLGGLATTVLNAELSYEIMTNLEIAAFGDAGTLSPDDEYVFNTDDLRYAIGLGIRYQLPIGPLRVDYGYNPDRQPGEASGALHLTFGFAF